MISIPNITIKPAAEFSPEWWEIAEQIIKAQICVQRDYLMDRFLTLYCEEQTIICTDEESGEFICQIFMPDAAKNGFRFIRETLVNDINELPEDGNCMFFLYADGLNLIGGNVDLTMLTDVSDKDASINFCLTDGSDITLDFDKVLSFSVDSNDPDDKTWSFEMESGAEVVLTYDVM